jgi:hypothetical protein
VQVIAAMTQGKAPLISASELARMITGVYECGSAQAQENEEFFEIAFVAGDVAEKPGTCPPIPSRHRNGDSDSERRQESESQEVRGDVPEDASSHALDPTSEQRILTVQQQHQQQKLEPLLHQQAPMQREERESLLHQQAPMQREEGAQGEEGEEEVEVAFTERQSHQHGLKRASGEDFKISISRSGGTSAFSRVASGGAERTGSSVSETKPETLVCCIF